MPPSYTRLDVSKLFSPGQNDEIEYVDMEDGNGVNKYDRAQNENYEDDNQYGDEGNGNKFRESYDSNDNDGGGGGGGGRFQRSKWDNRG